MPTQDQLEYAQQMMDSIRQDAGEDGRGDIGGQVFDKGKYGKLVRELSRVSVWRTLWAIGVQWAVIVAAFGAAIWSGHWAVYILAAIVVTTRQHAMGILIHDACHYRLFPNRKLNDLLSDLLVGFHMGMSTSLYRKWHYPHHRYVNTDRDPEWLGEQTDPDTWSFPKTKMDMVRVFAKDIFGLNIIKMAAIMGIWSPWSRLFISSKDPAGIPVREKVSLIFFAVVVGYALMHFDLMIPYLLLWMLPSLTLLNVVFKFRSYAEHKVVRNKNELSDSRTVSPSLLERFFIAPLHVSRHLEHHLFPSVPFFNLGRLHRELMKDPVFRAEAHHTQEYLDPHRGVLAELTTFDAEALPAEPAA